MGAEYIDNFAAAVREILEERSREPADFVSVAIAGEQLRRACELGEPTDAARSALDAYDRALPSFVPPAFDDVRRELDDVIAQVERYAAERDRDPEEGEDLVYAIDDALSIVAACVRVGCVSEEAAGALSSQLTEWMRTLAPRIVELAQLAEDRQILFGADARLPGLHAWWEPLAELSPSRLALHATVRAEARRERRIADALKAYEASIAPPVVPFPPLVIRMDSPLVATASAGGRELVTAATPWPKDNIEGTMIRFTFEPDVYRVRLLRDEEVVLDVELDDRNSVAIPAVDVVADPGASKLQWRYRPGLQWQVLKR